MAYSRSGRRIRSSSKVPSARAYKNTFTGPEAFFSVSYITDFMYFCISSSGAGFTRMLHSAVPTSCSPMNRVKRILPFRVRLIFAYSSRFTGGSSISNFPSTPAVKVPSS